jgi:S-ribosylhomocysteine lyase LuxS involved in autoinducer biosynthesis
MIEFRLPTVNSKLAHVSPEEIIEHSSLGCQSGTFMPRINEHSQD